jgi:transcriptional regulator GlxA family with amidase domain
LVGFRRWGRDRQDDRTDVKRPPFTRVAVLLFGGAPLLESAVPLSVFGVDRSATGAPTFTVTAIAAERAPVMTTAGVEIRASHDLAAVLDADVVIIPTWRDPTEIPPPRVLKTIRDAHDRGVTVVGLCLGTFVVAAAGLLDGRRAATHWYHAETLAALHPAVEVDASVLFVDHGDVLTSAGTAAGIDACLHLVRTAHGAEAANAIARRMVVSPQRAGGQAQFIEHPLPDIAPGNELDDVLSYAMEHLDDDLSISNLAARANMSRRSFDRRFRALTGVSPHQWIQHQRIVHAQRLLETTDLSIDAIARAVGFGTAVSLRPHFHDDVGLSPRAYRDAFQSRV